MLYEPQPGARWIRANWESLVERYRFEWVAATGSALVTHDRELQNVIDATIKPNLIQEVVFAFVNVPARRDR